MYQEQSRNGRSREQKNREADVHEHLFEPPAGTSTIPHNARRTNTNAGVQSCACAGEAGNEHSVAGHAK